VYDMLYCELWIGWGCWQMLSEI